MTDIAKKQYVLSSCKLPVENMQEHELDGMYLYTHRELNMQICHAACGEVILLGNAYCMDQAGKEPKEDLESFAGEDLARATDFWTGRWVLISRKELIRDAAGLMGGFYGKRGNDWVVSSSAALLSSLTGEPLLPPVKPEGLSWYILPGCVVRNGKALLCTQRLCFTQEGLTVAPNDWMRSRQNLSTKEKSQAAADMLVNGLKNIHQYSGREILLALTGGKDSRVSFAALLKAGVPFSCYTAQHPNISHSDRNVPKKLAQQFGISYRYIPASRKDPRRLEDYRSFTAGNADGADAGFFACGQFAKLPENAIVIRSGLYEAGQSYGRSIAAGNMDGFTADMFRYYNELQSVPVQKEAFAQWADYANGHPVEFVDIRDRFYLEQRVGGWAAAIEQSLDMNAFASVQIANCAQLLSVLLSASEQERENTQLPVEMMKVLQPEVLSCAINQVSPLDKLTRVKAVFRDPAGKIRRYLAKRVR